MAGDISKYLRLVTSEHREKPNFIAFLSAVLQPIADNIELTESFYLYYDIDLAIGVQLDKVGEWVGRDRRVAIPNVYFSLDVAGLGLDEGYLRGPFDPDTYLTSLDDDHYRLLLKAVIVNNSWDGSVSKAYEVWDNLFGDAPPFIILIQDTGQMTMFLTLLNKSPLPIDVVTQALFNTGEISVRPAGVAAQYGIIQNVGTLPVFGLDVENDNIAGLDVGAFGQETFGG
jgi:hypothetical protein